MIKRLFKDLTNKLDTVSHKLFLAIMFLFGLVLITPYGAHLDQVTEQEILYSNVLEVLEKFNIGDQLCKELETIGIVPIGTAIDRDHGASALYPMFWIYFVNQKSSYVGNIIWHVYIYVVCFAGVIALYKLCDNLYGKKTALLTAILYFLSPRIFAEMHYNNKDMVLLSITIIMFFCGARLRQNTSTVNAILFGVAGAFISNMRIIGLFMWGLVGLYVAIYKLVTSPERKVILVKILISIMAAALCFYIITPAVWGDISGYIRYCIDSSKDYRWNDYVLFMGSRFSKVTTGFPGKYLPVTMALTIPVGVLILALIGIIAFAKNLIKKDNLHDTAFTIVLFLCGFIPLGYAVVNRTPLYNGWRHFYFVYASIMILVAAGVQLLFKIGKSDVYASVILVLFSIVLLVGIIINHPYEYAYYNIIAGENVESKYELDYWDMSIKQCLEYIADNNKGTDVSVATCDNPTAWGVEAELSAIRGKSRGHFIVEENHEYADYVIINRTYAELYSKGTYEKIKENREKYYSVRSYGNTLCEVYK